MPLIQLPISVKDALAAYYQYDLRCRFFFGGEMDAEEVFDPAGFLPIFAHIAEARARALFDMSLMPIFTPHPGGTFSVQVAFPENPGALPVFMVLKAAEDVLGETRNREIDLEPIYRYFHTPKEEREKLPWPPGKTR
ncbi:MAG: hypothetical protein BroJett038_24210 [Chloroflexota bacterium]|jgi:hypothetical protein|nr:MAG: hypothetical protein BroJett038_24210 [Chloroflexota bacterium]